MEEASKDYNTSLSFPNIRRIRRYFQFGRWCPRYQIKRSVLSKHFHWYLSIRNTLHLRYYLRYAILYNIFIHHTHLVASETAMGTSIDAQNDVNSEYFENVNILLKILIDRAFSPFLGIDLLYPFSSTYQREQKALKVVHGYSRTVIERKMKEFLKNRSTKEQTTVDDLGRKKRKAFLDLLLEYSSTDPSFTYEDICEEVDTFMFEVSNINLFKPINISDFLKQYIYFFPI